MVFYRRRAQTPTQKKFSAIVLMLIGGIMLIVGFFGHMKHQKLLRVCTESVSGTVTFVDSKQVRNSRRSYSYHTEYKATISIDDTSHFKRSSVETPWSRKSISGDQVMTVKYDPDNSDNYYVEGYFSDNGMAAVLGGGLLFFIGIIYLFLYLRSR